MTPEQKRQELINRLTSTAAYLHALGRFSEEEDILRGITELNRLDKVVERLGDIKPIGEVFSDYEDVETRIAYARDNRHPK